MTTMSSSYNKPMTHVKYTAKKGTPMKTKVVKSSSPKMVRNSMPKAC